MLSSALVKCIAILLTLQVQAFAFVAPSTNTASPSAAKIASPFQCYATKKENCPGKTAFKNNNNIGGIGGLNINNTNRSPAPKKSVAKSSSMKSKKVASKSNVAKKKTQTTASKEVSDPTKTPWSTIILAFLIPWKNPNSIFLYMLIAVSVLGQLNDTPPPQ